MNAKTVLLALLIATTFAACNTDKENLEPTVTLEDYYGTYNVSDNCGNNYVIIIREVYTYETETEVVIDNLLNRYDYTYATITGNNINFTDSEYAMCNGNPATYESNGSGTFANDIITINYTWSHCGDGGDCMLTATKQ